jgi:sulfur-oxidizing protein SoxY
MLTASGLLLPIQVLAFWNQAAFTTKNLQTAIQSVTGSDLSEASNHIDINIPNIIEIGTPFSISVSTSLKNVSLISLFAEKNSTPLLVLFELNKECLAYISTRITMYQSSHIMIIVSSNGKHYSHRKKVNISIKNCSH